MYYLHLFSVTSYTLMMKSTNCYKICPLVPIGPYKQCKLYFFQQKKDNRNICEICELKFPLCVCLSEQQITSSCHLVSRSSWFLSYNLLSQKKTYLSKTLPVCAHLNQNREGISWKCNYTACLYDLPGQELFHKIAFRAKNKINMIQHYIKRYIILKSEEISNDANTYHKTLLFQLYEYKTFLQQWQNTFIKFCCKLVNRIWHFWFWSRW